MSSTIDECSRIFSSNDVIQYLERKGLSSETIKRLQHFELSTPININQQEYTNTKQRKGQRKTQQNYSRAIEQIYGRTSAKAVRSKTTTKYVTSSKSKLPPLQTANEYSNASNIQWHPFQEETQVLANTTTNTKKTVAKKRRKKRSQSYTNKLKKSLSLERQVIYSPNKKGTLDDPDFDPIQIKKQQKRERIQRHKQMIKHYSDADLIHFNQNNIQSTKRKTKHKTKFSYRNKYRSTSEDRTNVKHKTKKKEHSNRNNETWTLEQLQTEMEKTLGKDKKKAIEQYYRKIYGKRVENKSENDNIKKATSSKKETIKFPKIKEEISSNLPSSRLTSGRSLFKTRSKSLYINMTSPSKVNKPNHPIKTISTATNGNSSKNTNTNNDSVNTSHINSTSKSTISSISKTQQKQLNPKTPYKSPSQLVKEAQFQSDQLLREFQIQQQTQLQTMYDSLELEFEQQQAIIKNNNISKLDEKTKYLYNSPTIRNILLDNSLKVQPAASDNNILNIQNDKKYTFEINDYLLPNLNGLGTEAIILGLLYTGFYNQIISVNFDHKLISLNVGSYPKIKDLSLIYHKTKVANTHPCNPIISDLVSIKVNTEDWKILLPDKRKEPELSEGDTARIPLFIPKNNKNSRDTTDNHLRNPNVNASDFMKILPNINNVQNDTLQMLSAPNLHNINELPPHLIKEQKLEKEKVRQEKLLAEQEIKKQNFKKALKNQSFNINNDNNETKIDLSQNTEENNSLSNVNNNPTISHNASKVGNFKDAEFLTTITDLIVEKIQNKLDMSGIGKAKIKPQMEQLTNSHENLLLKQQQLQQQQQKEQQQLQQQLQQQSINNNSGNTVEITKTVSELAETQELENNEEQRGVAIEPEVVNNTILQGAIPIQKSLGSAKLSLSVAGLKDHMTAPEKATASVDPYGSIAHSTLKTTDKFGPNTATTARLPGQQTTVPNVIESNIDGYQYQPALTTPINNNQQQSQMFTPNMNNMNNMFSPMNFNPMMSPMTPMNMNPLMNPLMWQQFQLFQQQQMQQFQNMQNNMPNITNSNNRNKTNNENNSVHSKRPGTGFSVRSRSNVNSRGLKRRISNDSIVSNANEATIKDLFTKAVNGRHQQVEQMFAQTIDPNTEDKNGNTVLHVGAQNGNKRLIKTALRWGADINRQNKEGQTALHYLFAYKYETLAAYLISKGAKDTILNTHGYSCYDGLRPNSARSKKSD